eukprot:m.77085 g.77085  ORF g.77085 m.77085 type:complete len:525 (-) comp14451_c0_seq1:82-1656(-)
MLTVWLGQIRSFSGTMALSLWLLLGCLAIPGALSADSGTCSLCQTAITDVETFLESNHTQNEIVDELEKVCKLLPAADQDKCVVAIDQLLPQINESLDSIVTKYSDFALCSMLGLCQVDCCATPYLPEQIHLSLGADLSEMVVMWTTLLATPQPIVRFGTDPDNLNQTAAASTNTSNYGGWRGSLYTATMTGLSDKTTYYYQVGDPTIAPDFWMKPAWSQPAHLKFTTGGRVGPNQPCRMANIGDVGATDVSMLTYMRLVDRRMKGEVDMLLHDGDIGYADGYQPLWDAFLRKMETVGGFIPVMTAPGNHEGFFNFHTYKARFTMPFAAAQSSDPLYYSFNYANVHVVSLNSEGFMGLSPNHINTTSPIYTWLQKDLASVDRKVTPWVIAMLHRPLYCTGKTRDCKTQAKVLQDGLEALFYDNKVDLVLQAHIHNYQVTWPVYQQKTTQKNYVNPAAPVYVVNGAGGNKEHMDGTSADGNDWYRTGLRVYGYGLITSNNATTLTYQYFASEDDSLQDEFTLQRQ